MPGKICSRATSDGCTLPRCMRSDRFTCCCREAISSTPTRSGTTFQRSPHGSGCSWWRRRKAGFSPATAAAVADDYFERYWWLWSQPQLAPVLATIPSLMMWDDHDIFDGWGSWSQEWQQCPVFQGIWTAARENFALFQLGARPDDLPDGFSDRRGGQFGWSYRIGDVGIVAPDLRSERSRDRVMGDAGWRSFTAALEGMKDCRHVLLLSSMPLVTCDLRALERFFNLLPGHQTWEDDLVDQWPSRAHGAEWTRLLRALTAFSAANGACVTSLSGEVHLGALGLIESRGTRIYQLTSSGIVHPPPSAKAVRVLEWIGARNTTPGTRSHRAPAAASGARPALPSRPQLAGARSVAR